MSNDEPHVVEIIDVYSLSISTIFQPELAANCYLHRENISLTSVNIDYRVWMGSRIPGHQYDDV